jgi:hypothetical protein
MPLLQALLHLDHCVGRAVALVDVRIQVTTRMATADIAEEEAGSKYE